MTNMIPKDTEVAERCVGYSTQDVEGHSIDHLVEYETQMERQEEETLLWKTVERRDERPADEWSQ